MPIMRNPFRKQDENARPATSGAERPANGAATKPIDIEEKEQPAEYKLSEINDSGVFIPPSPPAERRSFWTTSSSRSTTSSKSNNHRSVFNENEPFNISRESFDSYRRSFDISARSPVIQPTEQRPRASLDSRTFMPPPGPRNSNSFHRPLQVPGTQQEEDLEEVALHEPEVKPAKKRGMLSRIMDSNDSHVDKSRENEKEGKTGSSWHHFGGRKRGQSGQGAELGSIPRREETPKPESGLRREEQQQQPPAQQVQPQTQQQPSIQVQAPPQPQQPQQQQDEAGAEKENAQAPVAVS